MNSQQRKRIGISNKFDSVCVRVRAKLTTGNNMTNDNGFGKDDFQLKQTPNDAKVLHKIQAHQMREQ